jgi:hypothetical protein
MQKPGSSTLDMEYTYERNALAVRWALSEKRFGV